MHKYFPAGLKLECILEGTVAFSFEGKVYFADPGKNMEDKEGNSPEGYPDLKLLDVNEELGIAVLQNSRVVRNDPNSDSILTFQVK